MIKYLNTVSALAVLTLFTACASTEKLDTVANPPVPQNILLVPAVDLSVNEVAVDVPKHLGLDVRWGGKIIAAVPHQGNVRLTVLAFPLGSDGKPERRAADELIGGEFMVDVATFDFLGEDRFITVFGPISNQVISGEGSEQQVLPVVAALEAKEWDQRKSSQARSRLRGRSNGRDFSNGIWMQRGFCENGRDIAGRVCFRDLSPYGTLGHGSR